MKKMITAAINQAYEKTIKKQQECILMTCDLSIGDLATKAKTRITGMLPGKYQMFVVFSLAMLFLIWSRNVSAFTVPAAGSFAYDIYDVAVNDILKGPIGFVAGIGFIVLCVFFIARQMVLPSILCIFAGIILIKADSIVTSLGCLIR
jgi:hypothetical protein